MSVKGLTDTASITLLTGLPGSGKTLRTVSWIKEAIDKGERVFVSNLNGLKLPHIEFSDPREWEQIPAGSVLVVDEAQKFFRARRGGDPPPYLTAMETIRHMGIRLLLTTQQPDYLDTHLRGLVGKHEHLLRIGGKPQSNIWRHNEVMDNVRSERARSRYDSQTWDFPPENYDLYDSAEVHTVKRVMSSRMKRGLILAGITGALILGVGWKFFGFFDGAKMPSAEAVALPSVGREASGPVERPSNAKTISAVEKHQPHSLDEYTANLTPRIGSLPWSAPVFDERSVVAEPRVFCMESGAGTDAQGEYQPAGLSCVTEQGTRHVMQPEAARMLARWGEPYNPYRNPDMVQAAPPAAVQTPSGGGAPATASMSAAQISGYGDLGITNRPGG